MLITYKTTFNNTALLGCFKQCLPLVCASKTGAITPKHHMTYEYGLILTTNRAIHPLKVQNSQLVFWIDTSNKMQFLKVDQCVTFYSYIWNPNSVGGKPTIDNVVKLFSKNFNLFYYVSTLKYVSFTFTHLADAFIQINFQERALQKSIGHWS